MNSLRDYKWVVALDQKNVIFVIVSPITRNGKPCLDHTCSMLPPAQPLLVTTFSSAVLYVAAVVAFFFSWITSSSLALMEYGDLVAMLLIFFSDFIEDPFGIGPHHGLYR